MANGLVEKKSLQDIAAAIRVKNGSSNTYKPAEMASAIMELKIGGNVIVSDVVKEVIAVGGETVIKIPKTETTVPEVGDFIIGQTKQDEDYDVAIYKITNIDKDTEVDNYVCTVQVVENMDVIGVDSSDATALATDIVSGKTAYINNVKVIGTFEGVDSSDADALANEIVKGKTAYVNNVKVTGTFEGVDSSDADALATDIISGKTAYINNTKVTGTVNKLDSIAVNSTNTEYSAENGKVTLSSTVGVNSGEKKYVDDTTTNAISVSQTDLASTIALTADKIKKGETVLGVAGTFTEDADALATDIISGKTAYVNGVKITGTFERVDTSDATATAANIMKDKTAYINDIKVTGTMEALVSVEGDSTSVSKHVSDTAPGIEVLANNLFTDNKYTTNTSIVQINVPYTEIATLEDITADKIAKGVTVMGVVGTFEATTEKEAKIAELEAEVARLQGIINSYADLNEEVF